MTQILTGVGGIVALFGPAESGGGGLPGDELTWIWRGVITASLLLNLFFLRNVYKKVQKVGPATRAIATLHVAVDYLAREATEHGSKRQADHLIFKMLDDVKKLTATREDE